MKIIIYAIMLVILVISCRENKKEGRDEKATAVQQESMTKEKKEANDIFLKYGIKDKQELVEWVKNHRKEIRQYRKDHPEYKAHSIYPEFEAANAKIHEFSQAGRNAKS